MEIGEVTVLALGSPVIRQPQLLSAALDRIAEAADSSGVVVFCPTPLVIADALATRGYRTVALAGSNLNAEFTREIVQLGGIPVVDGGQRDAIELAAALGAAKAVIYTDSQGVMSANPNRVGDAVSVRYISHVELMELAEHRASPLSADAAREASISGVTFEIRNVSDNEGTVVRADGYEDRFSPITSITVSSGYSLISMRIKPSQEIPAWTELQLSILEQIAAAGVSIEMLQSFPFILRFLAPANRIGVMQALAQQHGLVHHTVQKCAKICIVGTGVRSTAGVFYRSLRALSAHGVPVLHWSDSNVSLQFVVNESFTQLAEKSLHAELAPGSDVSVGPAISFDADLGLVRLNGREVRLGARQAQLLRFMLDNVGRVMEAEELARNLFGGDGKDELAAVRVHLHNLRKKIEANPDSPRYIVTVPDQGYIFVR